MVAEYIEKVLPKKRDINKRFNPTRVPSPIYGFSKTKKQKGSVIDEEAGITRLEKTLNSNRIHTLEDEVSIEVESAIGDTHSTEVEELNSIEDVDTNLEEILEEQLVKDLKINRELSLLTTCCWNQKWKNK